MVYIVMSYCVSGYTKVEPVIEKVFSNHKDARDFCDLKNDRSVYKSYDLIKKKLTHTNINEYYGKHLEYKSRSHCVLSGFVTSENEIENKSFCLSLDTQNKKSYSLDVNSSNFHFSLGIT